jgi:hypothetical protein
MTHPALQPQQRPELRQRAAERLTGVAALKGAAAQSTEAFAVLHRLATSPDTAANALALLHELQVYQVELDLQADEVRESRDELEAMLRQQTERWDALPVGCLRIDHKLQVYELNQTGAALLGLEPGHDSLGLAFDACLSVASRLTLHQLLARIDAGAAHATATLQWQLRNRPPLAMRASISADPSGPRSFLLVLTPADDAADVPATPA